MTFFSDLSDTIKALQKDKKDIFEEDIGIEVCPYFYTDDEHVDAWGLSKAYDTSSIRAFAQDAAFQTVINPIATCIGNFLLVGLCLWDTGVCLYDAIMRNSPDDQPLLEAADALFAACYFLVHAVIDPAWELLAAVTRPLSTLGAGVQSCYDNLPTLSCSPF